MIPQPIRDLIQSALDEGLETHAMGDIEAGIADGSLLLLASQKSVMVVETVEYPRRKALNIFLGAGDLAELKQLAANLDNIARGRGCDMITVMGRMGWARALRDTGYKAKLMILQREVAP